jgi:hypothetical protein
MKKTIFKSGRGILVIGLGGLLALGSCRKSDEIARAIPNKLAGDWKLSDLMLVNAGDKPPRKLEELPRLNDLRLNMSPDGRLSSGGHGKGTWTATKDSISLRFDGEEPLDLKISRLEPRLMVLEYGFDAHDGSQSGTIYYAFAK